MFGRFNSPIKTSFCNNPPPICTYGRPRSASRPLAGAGERGGEEAGSCFVQLTVAAYVPVGCAYVPKSSKA